MIYTVLVTVEVAADSQREAYAFIKHALGQATKQEVVYRDAEVIDQTAETEDDVPEKLTRQERLQGLADRGTDTHEESRSER